MNVHEEIIKSAVEDKEPQKFRQFTTSSNKTVLAGKNAKNNDELVRQAEPNEEVFHTAAPGSPFVNIKGKATAKDIKEAATFCASKSQAWRNTHSDVIIHHFKGRDTYKIIGMKTGTFGVKKFKEIKVKKIDIESLNKK